MRLHFTVPGTPPSVNTYVRHSRGRHFLSNVAKDFKENAKWMAVGSLPVGWDHTRMFRVEVVCRFKSRRAPDCDNLPKLVMDGLQAAGVFSNDNQVDVLRVSRHFGVAEPRTEITVEALTEV